MNGKADEEGHEILGARKFGIKKVFNCLKDRIFTKDDIFGKKIENTKIFSPLAPNPSHGGPLYFWTCLTNTIDYSRGTSNDPARIVPR